MINIPLAIISAFSAVMFFKCEYDEVKAVHKGGAILMGALTVISSVCLGMSIMGVGC